MNFYYFTKVLLLTCVLLILLGKTNVYYYNGVYLNKGHTPAENDNMVETLRKLKRQSRKLVNILKKVYPTDIRTIRLVSKWNGSIHEMEHHENKRSFAYNRNKGSYIAVCLHDADNKMNTFNEIFFVTMHEMAHIMTAEYGHNEYFWNAFRWLIKVAADHKLFKNIDYAKHPSKYCLNKIKHNPYFD